VRLLVVEESVVVLLGVVEFFAWFSKMEVGTMIKLGVFSFVASLIIFFGG